MNRFLYGTGVTAAGGIAHRQPTSVIEYWMRTTPFGSSVEGHCALSARVDFDHGPSFLLQSRYIRENPRQPSVLEARSTRTDSEAFTTTFTSMFDCFFRVGEDGSIHLMVSSVQPAPFNFALRGEFFTLSESFPGWSGTSESDPYFPEFPGRWELLNNA